jgi:hypothetical protein
MSSEALARVEQLDSALPTWWGPELPDAHRSGDLLIVAAVARCLDLPHDDAAQWLLEQHHPLRFLLCKRLSSTTSKSAWVYLAVDRVLGRPIVLKILDVAAAKEARLLAAVAHPNVVMVHDAGVFEDRTYIVLQWCEGATLASYARTHAWSDVLARCIEAGRGLAWCHSLGLVHGDVKPNNVLIHDERALLADFGLAGRPREFGPIAGTLAYMSPERDHGIWVAAGDVFAFARTAMVALELSSQPPAAERSTGSGRDSTRNRAVLDILALALADEVADRPTMAQVLEVLVQAHASAGRNPTRFRADWRGAAFASAFVGVVSLSLGSGYSMHELFGPTSASATAPAEPDIEHAIEVLRAGNALAAWDEFQAAEQLGNVELDRALELARIAVEAAERAPAARSEEASRAALLITLQLITLADQRGEAEVEAVARRLSERAEAAALRLAR